VATGVLRGPAPALAKFKGSPELVVDAAMEESKPPGTYRKRLQVVNLPTDIAAEIRPDSVLMTTLKTPKK
jgi:YbbR domain-containing protein